MLQDAASIALFMSALAAYVTRYSDVSADGRGSEQFLRVFRCYAVNAFLDVHDLRHATIGDFRDQSRGLIIRQLALFRQQFAGFCLCVGERFVEVLVESHRDPLGGRFDARR